MFTQIPATNRSIEKVCECSMEEPQIVSSRDDHLIAVPTCQLRRMMEALTLLEETASDNTSIRDAIRNLLSAMEYATTSQDLEEDDNDSAHGLELRNDNFKPLIPPDA